MILKKLRSFFPRVGASGDGDQGGERLTLETSLRLPG